MDLLQGRQRQVWIKVQPAELRCWRLFRALLLPRQLELGQLGHLKLGHFELGWLEAGHAPSC